MAVAVLITNERARDALSHVRSARFSMEWGSGKTHSLIVGLLADLDRVQGRHELESLVAQAKGHLPVVLMSAKVAPRSDAAFQALAYLTWLIGQEVYIAPDAAAIGRMVFARQAKAEEALIASATIEDGKIVVWSCEPRRYAVDASEIPALVKLSSAGLADFAVSDTGSRIHWNSGDVDLDLTGIRVHADPDVRRQHQVERRREAVQYAGAIRAFREERGLKQTDIHGLSERQVRRLEEGETLPHSSTLSKLSAAHGMSIEDYLQELAKRSTRRLSGSRSRKARPTRRRAAKR